MTTITASVAENPPSRISKGPRVAMFADAFGKEPKECELSAILEAVKSGHYERRVSQLRELRAMDGEAYQKEKRSLPAFCISGTAASRTGPLTHSGLLQVDIDTLNGTLDNIREQLKVDPHVYFGFVSPSGDGLKLGLRIDGERHGDSFTAAQNYFKLRYGLEIDPLVKDRLRLCFVSYDPELWTNEAAQPLPIPEQQGHSSAAPEIIILPSGAVSISESARVLFQRIAPTRTIFWRGGALVEIVEIDGVQGLDVLRPDKFRSDAEKHGQLFAWRAAGNGGAVLKPSKMSLDDAKAIIAANEGRETLPHVASVLRCPVVTETKSGDVAILGRGYHPELGGLLIVTGDTPPQVPLPEAVESLRWLVEQYHFQTEADRSRALAAFITPALRLGGFIRGNIPIDCAEADKSQAGKGHRLEKVCTIYNEKSYFVTSKSGGVGSVDESFQSALISARPFVCLDNFRGRMDSQHLEAFLTCPGLFPARIPYKGEALIDPKRFNLQMSSNGLETTRDLANRASICRIRKRPSFNYRDTLGELQRRQPYFLGCVFSIVAEWIANGKPRTSDTRHDFREWSQTLDWIVQNILGCAPLLDGHEAAQERTSNPALSWLRAVALAVEAGNQLGVALIASELVEVCELHAVTIPGDPSDEDRAKRQVGKLCKQLFRDGGSLDLDGFTISRTRKEYHKPSGDLDFTNAYTFSK